jgi:hypothetical protein
MGSEIKPKRKAMTAAERVRRHRKRRAVCNVSCPSQWDATVPTIGADFVTHPKTTKTDPRETAKNVVQMRSTVTETVPTSGTHIHLTMGGGLSGTTPTTPRGQKGDQTHFGPNVTPLRALPPGHERCKLPNNNSLPLGWHWCMSEQRVVTDTGVVVPLVDDPLVGTEAQREALRALRKWEATVIPFRRRGAA